MAQPLKVFISYSRKDIALKDKLLEQLRVLERSHGVEVWTDADIPPGAKRQEEIERAMGTTDVALLLVSASFLASEFVNKTELPELLKRRASNGLIVIPVIMKECLWEQHLAIAPFQVLPRGGVPIASRSKNVKAKALKEVAMAIHRLATFANPEGASLELPSGTVIGIKRNKRKRVSQRKVLVFGAACVAVAIVIAYYYISATNFTAQGQVLHVPDGKPISGAEILMVGLTCENEIRTSERGYFYLDCPVSPFSQLTRPRIKIRLPEKASYCEPIDLLPRGMITVIDIDDNCVAKVSSAEREVRPNIMDRVPSPDRARRAYSGALYSYDNEPVRNARVHLTGTTCEATTDDTGFFDFGECGEASKIQAPKMRITDSSGRDCGPSVIQDMVMMNPAMCRSPRP